MRTRIICLLLIMSAGSFMCAKTDGNYTVEIVDGVRYITNYQPQWGDVPEISLELDCKIGELETEDDNFILFRPNDMYIDRFDNIYVCDSRNFRIQKYNADGEFILTIGRQGQGPGEFPGRGPERIFIDKDTLIVFEQKIFRYTLDGDFMYHVEKPAGWRDFEYLGNDTYVMAFGWGERTNHSRVVSSPMAPPPPTNTDYKRVSGSYESDNILALLNSDGKVAKEFGTHRKFDDDFVSYCSNTFHSTVDDHGNIYLSFKSYDRIDKYDGSGKHQMTIYRPTAVPEKFERYMLNMGRIELPDVRTNMFAQDIGVDSAGRIWVLNYTIIPEENEMSNQYLEFNVFNDEGILLGSLPLDVPADAMRVFGSSVYIIDTHNEMCVYKYDIVELN
ncbi:6-bladed beta-propeller [candidate division KSB1 bacterium]